MARKWRKLAPLFSRHCHRAIIFYFSATATCATCFSLRQYLGGGKNGASAQHWLEYTNIKNVSLQRRHFCRLRFNIKLNVERDNNTSACFIPSVVYLIIKIHEYKLGLYLAKLIHSFHSFIRHIFCRHIIFIRNSFNQYYFII